MQTFNTQSLDQQVICSCPKSLKQVRDEGWAVGWTRMAQHSANAQRFMEPQKGLGREGPLQHHVQAPLCH